MKKFLSLILTGLLLAQPVFAYTVKAGDSVYKIGKSNNLSVSQIAETNGLKDPNKIYVGQNLNLHIPEILGARTEESGWKQKSFDSFGNYSVLDENLEAATPGTTNAQDLGSAFSVWDKLYINSIVVSTSSGSNIYVATTGSDSGPCTISSPCATIAKALAKIPLIENGPVTVHLADGTYSENNLVIPAGLQRDTSQDSTTTTPPGQMVLHIQGNSTTPANVTISHGSEKGFLIKGVPFSVLIEGIKFVGAALGSGMGLSIDRSVVFLKDTAYANQSTSILVRDNSFVKFQSSVNTTTFSNITTGISALNGVKVDLDENIVMTDVGTTGINISNFGTIWTPSANNPSISITGTSTATRGITAGSGAVFSHAGTGSLTIKNINASGALPIYLDWYGRFRIASGSSVITFDNCVSSTSLVYIARGSQIDSTFGTTWSYINGSSNIFSIDPISSANDTNGFDGATFEGIEVTTEYVYGGDFRYGELAEINDFTNTNYIATLNATTSDAVYFQQGTTPLSDSQVTTSTLGVGLCFTSTIQETPLAGRLDVVFPSTTTLFASCLGSVGKFKDYTYQSINTSSLIIAGTGGTLQFSASSTVDANKSAFIRITRDSLTTYLLQLINLF